MEDFAENKEYVRVIVKVKQEDDEEEFRSCCEDEDELRERENCAKEDSICCNDGNSFFMYFKGASVSGAGDSNSRVSGIGVIIESPCNNNESPIRVQKKLDFYVEKSVADYLALLDGLSLAIQKDIKRVFAFTDSKDLCNQIINDEELDNPLLLALRQRILEQAGNLDSFVLKHVPAIELQNATQLARVAIGLVSDPIEGDESKENCSICWEEKLSSTVLKLKCSHEFCSRCLKTYVEDKLRSSEVPIKCPQSKCKYLISLDECQLFLPFTSYESLDRVLTEANAQNSDNIHLCEETPECVSLWDEGAYYTEDSSSLSYQHHPSQQFEQWTWDSFVSLPTMMRDAYSEQERSQLALIQRFLAGGFGLSDHHQQQFYYEDEDDDRRSSSRCTDSYADAMKDLHQLPWLERFVSVITDDYYEDYIQ